MSTDEVINVDKSIKPYLDEIVKCLWSGHATIIVGSGLSKNAKPKGDNIPNFPDWSELGTIFYEKIHKRIPDKPEFLSVPKLAEQVEAIFGRQELDELLRLSIPDEHYEPSPLHEKLLQLPWADVFTTNYDTLLEKTNLDIGIQKYTVITDEKAIALSGRPRIFKLHGSLPSGHFVITEEDYRKYPTEHPLFANTARQALVENISCLIGFSGDDPNFMQWVGWMHDNLAKDRSSKVFLIGLFFSEEEKKLFEHRNIVLVDLTNIIRGNLKPVSPQPASDVESPNPLLAGKNRDEYYKALDLFSDFLLSRQIEGYRLGWPREQKLLHPSSNSTDKTSQAAELLSEWKRIRFSYPGWWILPLEGRNAIWTYTRNWVNYIPSLNDLIAPVDLEISYELVWRMEKCLCPISDQQANQIGIILHKYWPFPEHKTLEQGTVSLSDPAYRELPWDEIREKWLHLCLAMLRFYRQEGLHEKWQEQNDKLTLFIKYLSKEQVASLYYERTLYGLFALDIADIGRQLNAWPIDKSIPFWEVKRASLLAEIGQIAEAEKIIEQSLRDIRSQQSRQPTSCFWASQEAFAMLLFLCVKDSTEIMKGNWSPNNKLRQQFRNRWNYLKQYDCDPWNELRFFEEWLERETIDKRDTSIKKGFDVGRVLQTKHFGSDDNEAINAFAFLLFCEEAGIPFRISTYDLEKKSARGTLSRMAKYTPYWAKATMIRIGEANIVDELFNRESLHKMDVTAVDDLVKSLLKTIEDSKDDIKSGNDFFSDKFGIVLAHIIPEILSRLCCKCPLEAKYKLLEFLLETYNSDQKNKYRGISNLVERLLTSLSVKQRYKIIPKLLEFPIFDISDRDIINPFFHLIINPEYVSKIERPEINVDRITHLIASASSQNSWQRSWAISILGKLFDLNLLNKEQQSKFGEVLWCQLDGCELPRHTDYYKFAFLNLPKPTEIDVISRFKEYVQRDQFPSGSPVLLSGGEVDLCREIAGANRYLKWTDEERDSILQRLIKWWEAVRARLQEEEEPLGPLSVVNEIKSQLEKLIAVLVEVIAPTLEPGLDEGKKGTIQRLLTEFNEDGLPSLYAEAAFVHVFPDGKAGLISRIEHALTSNEDLTVVDGLRAIVVLLPHLNEAESANLLNKLGQEVSWRRRVQLHNALNTAGRLVKEQPVFITDNFEKLILDGLQDISIDTNYSNKITDLDFSEKLLIRQAAARLAYDLFVFYSERSAPIPMPIETWKTICQSVDEFAEIKNQWLTADDN